MLYLSFTLEGCSILRNFEFGKTKGKKKGGPYKRTQTAALWQAKFYLPHQAVAPQHIYCGAAVHLLWHHSRQAAVDETPSSTAACLLRQLYIAAAVHELQYMKYSFLCTAATPQEASKCHSLSPFIQSRRKVLKYISRTGFVVIFKMYKMLRKKNYV